MSVATSSGGGGRCSTGLASKVTSSIVMSSSIGVSVMTGVAGRAMASGGGGISISSGMSITGISSIDMLTSSACMAGASQKTTKWSTVATEIDPQNQDEKERLNSSLAVSRISPETSSWVCSFIVSPS